MARRIADEFAAMAAGHIAASGGPGDRHLPVLHLAVSFGPADHAEWLSGPKGRARLRAAAIAELGRRGKFWAWSIIDHTYRFTDGPEDAYPSPRLRVFAIDCSTTGSTPSAFGGSRTRRTSCGPCGRAASRPSARTAGAAACS